MGAGIGLASYTIGLAVTGNLHQWNIGGALKATFWGAVGGAVSAGLGELFSAAKVVKALGEAKFFVQAAAHGVSQGVLSVMQGGDFLSGAAGGFFGSLGASAFGGIAGEWANSMGGNVFFGALSGGIGAELSGGNFWQGAVTGGIVAGLNHVMHMDKGGMNDDQGDPSSSPKAQNPPINDGPVVMMGGPFDVFGVFEATGMFVESLFTDKSYPVIGKIASKLVTKRPIKAFGKTVLKTTTRMGRDGKAVEIIFRDGSKMDITSVRVKKWIPKTHPKAPSGSLQKVKFENSLPGSKGYKRSPTQKELDYLDRIN